MTVLPAYPQRLQLASLPTPMRLLQNLSRETGTNIWHCIFAAMCGGHFRSWLRTMNPAQPPSEAAVAQALRNTFPEFLLHNPDGHT
jgi:hypothetical protein